jgi:hypothetical protein
MSHQYTLFSLKHFTSVALERESMLVAYHQDSVVTSYFESPPKDSVEMDETQMSVKK